jgi:hypothetical protein
VATIGTCTALCCIALGLRRPDAPQQHEKKAEGDVSKAIALMIPASESDVKGKVVFTKWAGPFMSTLKSAD